MKQWKKEEEKSVEAVEKEEETVKKEESSPSKYVQFKLKSGGKYVVLKPGDDQELCPVLSPKQQKQKLRNQRKKHRKKHKKCGILHQNNAKYGKSIKFTYNETNEQFIIILQLKQVTKQNVEINFLKKTIECKIKVNHENFYLLLELAGQINPQKSTFQISAKNIQLFIHKDDQFYGIWQVLEEIEYQNTPSPSPILLPYHQHQKIQEIKLPPRMKKKRKKKKKKRKKKRKKKLEKKKI